MPTERNGGDLVAEELARQGVPALFTLCGGHDVRVAGVATNPDGTPKLTILDDGCRFTGDTVDFTATFDVLLTAQARYDIGIYFATDGDPNSDGALTGSCSVTTLDSANTPGFINLDTAPDSCGDIDAAHNPLQPTITLIDVACVDRNGDRKLDFPNCLSWRQPGSNEVCTRPTDAFPGSPSKCKCDRGFTVPIDVPPATIEVTKTANRSTVDEPGGAVTYTVSVYNSGVDPNPVHAAEPGGRQVRQSQRQGHLLRAADHRRQYHLLVHLHRHGER